jgi:flavorubredoxin
MSAFIDTLVSHNLQNRKFVLVENGSWAPTCAGLMKTKLEKLKNSEFLNETFCIKSTLKECQIEELNNVVNTIVNSINL